MGGLEPLNPFDQEGSLWIIYLGGGNAIHQFVEKLDAAQVAFYGSDLEALNTVKVGEEGGDWENRETVCYMESGML